MKITKNRKWIYLGILNTFSSVCFVGLALLSKYVLDAAQQKQQELVLIYTLILIGFIILGIAFKLVENFLYARWLIQREMELKRLLLETRLCLSFENAKCHSAILIQNYTTDIDNIVVGEMEVFPSLFYQIGRFIFALVLVIILDWRVLLILLGVALIGFILARLYSRRMKKLHADVLTKDGSMNSFFQETVENVNLVQAYAAKKSFLKHYDVKASAAKKSRTKKYNLQVFAMNIMVFVSNILYGACIGYGGYALAVGLITYGTLLALIQLIPHLQNPILSLSGLLNRYTLSKTSYERLSKSLVGEEMSEESIDAFDIVKIENLSYKYTEKPILNDLSFEIHPKDIIRITGESGIGKTTLFMVLMGFLKPNSGKICAQFNDKEYSNIASLFAYVPQDNILFSSTIRENFELLTDANEEEMRDALKFACLDEEIDSLDIQLNERGKGLSIGQIQRLVIAIAYAKKRPIFLLDEFSSALDQENASKIVKNFSSLGKTILYISHKDESFTPNKIIHL